MSHTASPGRRAARARPSTLRVALVHKMPTPYRVPVFDRIADQPGIDLTVVYASEREPNRDWTRPEGRTRTVWLPERLLRFGRNRDWYVHANSGVAAALSRIRPHVVVINGYNVTDLVALVWARLHGARVVCQIDGTVASEATLSRAHRLVRRVADRAISAYIGPSESSLRLFRSFGAPASACFWAPLAIDNARFALPESTARSVDLLFSGRLTEVKNPLFAIEVAAAVADRLERAVRLRIAGSGELEQEMRGAAAREPRVDVEFDGFIQQDGLPLLYGTARVFLFPTRWDPWGVVANEAAAAGTPVVVSPHAGAAGDLIRDGEGGFVVPLELDRWTDTVAGLLEDQHRWTEVSEAARARVQRYTWDAAARGFIEAVEHAASTALGAIR